MPERPKGRGPTLDPAHSVLVVVDVENEFVKPGGKMYPETLKGQERTRKFVSRIQKFVQRCRENNLRIIFIDSIRSADAPESRVFGRYQRLLEGTWHSAIIDEIKPLPTEMVVPKRCHDCFVAPLMEKTLEEMAIRPLVDTVIVTGGANGGCAYDAIIGFTQRYYRVVVPVDCTYGSEEGEKFLMEQMADPAYSYMTTLADSESIRFEPAAIHVEATGAH